MTLSPAISCTPDRLARIQAIASIMSHLPNGYYTIFSLKKKLYVGRGIETGAEGPKNIVGSSLKELKNSVWSVVQLDDSKYILAIPTSFTVVEHNGVVVHLFGKKYSEWELTPVYEHPGQQKPYWTITGPHGSWNLSSSKPGTKLHVVKGETPRPDSDIAGDPPVDHDNEMQVWQIDPAAVLVE